MRKILINVMAFGFIGGLLGYLGHPASTWEFWIVIVFLLVIQVNNEID